MRCGNRSAPAARYKVGRRWLTAEHCRAAGRCDRSDRCPCRCAGCLGAERAGCRNEALPPVERVPGLSPPGLCAACLLEYEAARKGEARRGGHVAALDAVEAMPGLCDHGQRVELCGACA